MKEYVCDRCGRHVSECWYCHKPIVRLSTKRYVCLINFTGRGIYHMPFFHFHRDCFKKIHKLVSFAARDEFVSKKLKPPIAYSDDMDIIFYDPLVGR